MKLSSKTVGLGAVLAIATGAVPAVAKSRCDTSTGVSGGHPKALVRLKGAPDRSLTSILGVLRRPATADDHLPRRAGPYGQRFLEGFEGEVNYRYIRQVGQTAIGTHYFVVPGYLPKPVRPSKRCLASLPKALRRVILDELHRYSTRRGRAIITLMAITDDGSSVNASALGVRELRRGASLEVSASVFRNDTTVTGLVPDGVSSVQVSARHRTASASVTDNFFVADLPTRVSFPAAVNFAWKAADGTTIKTGSWPPQP